MIPRDYLRVYELLRRAAGGYRGETDEEIANRIMAVAPRAALRLDAIREQCCSDPLDSAEQQQARIVSVIVGMAARAGRFAAFMPDAESCEPDGDTA